MISFRDRFQRSLPTAMVLLFGVLVVAAVLRLTWLVLAVSIPLTAFVLVQWLPPLWRLLTSRSQASLVSRVLSVVALLLLIVALPLAFGWLDPLISIYANQNWQAIGALGEGVIGAFGQILVALVALTIAWRQVSVDQRLSTQQNLITQAQTIDGFIQGISQLIVDDEGLLEDWPLERMLLEGRLAAVLSSVDRDGKARLLRFLSQARLLTPLRRDNRLGRAILDGHGNYEIDRVHGIAVVQLRRMLRSVDLSGTDLREVDFNQADLRGANLRGCDLRNANFSGCDLTDVDLSRSLLDGTLFHLGHPETASPIHHHDAIDLSTGVGTGSIVDHVDVSGGKKLEGSAFYYLAAWGGEYTRRRLPGNCKKIPDRRSSQDL